MPPEIPFPTAKTGTAAHRCAPRRSHANGLPSRRGLTLVELLTVIAIISILISILIPTVSTVRTSARKAKAKILLTQWATALETFRQEYGFYPAFDFAADEDNLIASAADTAVFVKALSGRNVDGSVLEATDTASGNKKRIRFYTFSEGEINASGQLVDGFDGDKIAILFDKNLDGIIKVGEDADDDYAAFPEIISGVASPPRWPTGGLRAGVAIYSPGPAGVGNMITTW
ncbi:MAG: prepilin-type N-terminal cleavage/methylation domain-containing protein [Opitutaceae bacterium]